MIPFEKLLKEISRECELCSKCEPCCTGYMIKKYIEARKPAKKAADIIIGQCRAAKHSAGPLK